MAQHGGMPPEKVVPAYAGNTRFAELAHGQHLGGFSPQLPFPSRFPYGPDSVIRKVASEPVLALLLPRALVMEIAHPKVGAGVAQHSSFQRRPLRRLWSTGDCALRLAFGDAGEALEAASHIYCVHDRVYGHLPDAAGHWDAGSAYTAHDAGLLLWVWATIVDTFRVGYERWVRPLRDDEADDLYADQKAFAFFFGIPPEMVPPERAAFDRYMEAALADDSLGASPTSRSLAHEILYFERWDLPSAVVRAQRVLSVATLDPGLAERLGVALGGPDRRMGARLDEALARYYNRLPSWRTGIPALYLAARRLGLGSVSMSARVGSRAARSFAGATGPGPST